MGLYAYSGGTHYSDYKEYLARAITPMIPGGRYQVSMSVSLGDNSKYAADGLGVWFYNNGPSTTITNDYRTLHVTPQVSYDDSIITDKSNWVRVVKTFVADSAFDNMVIGDYKDSTVIKDTLLTGTMDFAYYYIDSVVVLLDNKIYLNFSDTLLCAGDTFNVPFTIKPNFTFNAGNVFSAQLSDSSGNFVSPVVIGTLSSTGAGVIKCVIPNTVFSGTGYKIRILSSNVVDSSVNSKNIKLGIINPPKPTAANNGPICAGTALQLSATNSSSGLSYIWYGPTGNTLNGQNAIINTTQILDSGRYIVRSYLYGCYASDTTIATVHTMPLPVTASFNAPICEPDSLKLNCTNSTSGASYSWTGPLAFSSSVKDTAIAITDSAMSGDYIVTASLGTFCVQKDTINVVVKPLPRNIITSSNSPVCNGDTLKLSGYTSSINTVLSWQGPALSDTTDSVRISNVSDLNAGKYIITYNRDGCLYKDTSDVIVNHRPTPVTLSTNSPVCELDSIKLNSTLSDTGTSYRWEGPNNYTSLALNSVVLKPTIGNSGFYRIIVTSANGCFTEDSIDVIVKPLPQNLQIVVDNPICEGGTLHVAATTSSTNVIYNWQGSFGFTSQDSAFTINNITTANSGIYRLSATLDGCMAITDEDIKVLNYYFFLGNDTTICHDDKLILSTDINDALLSWQDGSIGKTYTVTESGVYSLKATTVCGLFADTIKVNKEYCDCNIIVPTAFSPNNDGLNDKIGAMIYCDISSYSFTIANRWGQVIFRTNDPLEKWNGTFDNHEAEIGTYSYYIKVVDTKKQAHLFKGDITLVR